MILNHMQVIITDEESNNSYLRGKLHIEENTIKCCRKEIRIEYSGSWNHYPILYEQGQYFYQIEKLDSNYNPIEDFLFKEFLQRLQTTYEHFQDILLITYIGLNDELLVSFQPNELYTTEHNIKVESDNFNFSLNLSNIKYVSFLANEDTNTYLIHTDTVDYEFCFSGEVV